MTKSLALRYCGSRTLCDFLIDASNIYVSKYTKNMKINLPTKYLVLGIVGGALVSPTAVLAQPQSRLDRGQPWARACEAALTDLVINEHPYVAQVDFIEDSEYQYQASNAETGVHGIAETKGPGRNASWHQFTFTCLYNIRRGKVSDVTYDIYGVNY